MKLQPLYDRLIVKVLAEDEKTSGGLFVPHVARENTPFLRAEVVATGHGRLAASGEVIPLKVKKGDVVLFFRAASSGEQLIVPWGEGELLTIRENHIIGIFEDLPVGTGLLNAEGREVVVSAS
jgi:chaperonin GroES